MTKLARSPRPDLLLCLLAALGSGCEGGAADEDGDGTTGSGSTTTGPGSSSTESGLDDPSTSTGTVDSSSGSSGGETTTGSVEAQQWVLVGNTRGDDVVRIDAQTGELGGSLVMAGAGGLHHPDTLRLRDDLLYVSSGTTPDDSAILRFDALTGDFVDVFAEGSGMHRPYGFDFGPDGMLYVASFLSDELLRYDATTGAFVDVFATGDGMPGGLNGPNDVTVGPDGALYVSTQGSVAVDGSPTYPGLPSEVLRIELDSGEGTVFIEQPTPLPDSLGFVSMLGVAFGPDCDRGECDPFTTDFAGGLRRYDMTGALVWEASTSYVAGAATGALAFGSEGAVFVPAFDTGDEEGPGVLLRFDAATGAPWPGDGLDEAQLVAPSRALVRPIGVAFVIEEG